LRASLITLLLFEVPVLAMGARQERLIDGWRPLHYSIRITLDDQLTFITRAQADLTLLILKDNLTVIDLDFGDMTVDSAKVNNIPAEFKRPSGKLNVELPKPFKKGVRVIVSISYHGKPKDGLILTSDKDGKPSAVGDNWPDRLHNWIPCFDHPSAKATITFTVTAPDRNLVVANGRLDRVENTSDATRTWTYTEAVPIPPYCMIIAVGQFQKLHPTDSGITSLSYYVPKSDAEFAMQGFAPAIPSLKYFSQTVAPYPYEKLALIVGSTRFGGMENSGAIVFTSTLFNPRSNAPISPVFNIRRGLVSLIAHEIAHQWFGDSVTESTWSDLWLSEGFATYFAGLFIQKHEGEEAFRDYMKQSAETYFAYARGTRTPIFDTQTENLSKLLNANNYQKGAWVLHMLRTQLGDKAFFQGVRNYYRRHKNSTASSDDLRIALERASRSSLRAFFQRWIYGAGHPRYGLSWRWNPSNRTARVILKQLQPQSFFPNPISIDITTSQGKRRFIIRPTSKQTISEIRLNDAPLNVILDPDNDVLKEVSPSSAAVAFPSYPIVLNQGAPRFALPR